MNDLISRQTAIRGYQEVCKEIKCGECSLLIKVNTEKGSHLITDCKLEAFLHDLPSAQPEQKKGKWIDEGFYADGHGAHAFRCSECGGHIIEYDADPFCRWCGADMRGSENG